MRQITNINEKWKYIKNDIGIENVIATEGILLDLPHTWNQKDGQDGGNDYYRGKCWYEKRFDINRTKVEEVWLELRGSAMMTDVYVNGTLAGHHDGGYSTFRVNITNMLEEENIVAVSVDNSATRTVYPQKADFTFYGGIYRDVYLIVVPKQHFALGYHGGNGLKITPKVVGKTAAVAVEVWIENAIEDANVNVSLCDTTQKEIECKICHIVNGKIDITFDIENVHLWDGKEDPYQYEIKAEIIDSGDEIASKFGCRSYSFDAEKGFFLNGRSYPLCGAARHQDWLGVGNAITRAMQEEDMQIMLEMGVNTIRTAHYQHDQYFYDLADQYGMIVWAEIPYITEHMPEARANTVSQMTELVVQNYNHPSIIGWALSNEITATGGVTEDLIENHRILNDLCHELDQTRPTMMANVFMLKTDSDLVLLTDIRSYNLYYGWYLGEKEDNDEWFDKFHAAYPGTVIGLSEFGADANPAYQTANPEKGDYTESYQVIYHEHMLKMWSKRPYIWAMHVWNMFDFGADGREEGGKPGQNQKGLVTFDRSIKKDAFYIYKAYLSKDPFVHICGRRYVDRTEEVTEIKVYSNQSAVTLSVDGIEVETRIAENIFKFRIKLTGEHVIEAKSGTLLDTIRIRKVEKQNPAYICPGREVVNWFERPDMKVKEGYYSIKDTMKDIKQNELAAALVGVILEKVTESYGDVAKDVQMPAEMQEIMNRQPIEKFLRQAGKVITPEMVVQLNKDLNRIKK